MNFEQIDGEYTDAAEPVWRNVGLSSFLLVNFKLPHIQERIRKEIVNGQIELSVLATIIADYVCIDWRDVRTPDGEELEYSRDMCIGMLVTNESLIDKLLRLSQN